MEKIINNKYYSQEGGRLLLGTGIEASAGGPDGLRIVISGPVVGDVDQDCRTEQLGSQVETQPT